MSYKEREKLLSGAYELEDVRDVGYGVEEGDYWVEESDVPDFIRTTAIDKLSCLTKRIRGVPGGTSAGKTFGIIPLLIDYCIKHRGKEVSVVSESIPHLRKGCVKDFIKIMRSTGRWQDSRWNRTHLKYVFGNGAYIEFFSVDMPDKLRGARRDVLYVNEANNVKWDAYMQLAMRTSKFIWIDFNPTHEFWYHTELVGEPDWEELVLTYLDNEAAPEGSVQEILKAKKKADAGDSWWANWYQVYGLGQVGILEGVIYENWEVIDDIPVEAEFLGQGLDFGYSNDPTAVVDVYKWNGYRILDEVLYSGGLLNSEISVYLRNPIIADSAEPKSIEELFRMGFDIRGVTKGADSILFGIQVMQGQKYLVTSRSLNLIKEFRMYAWEEDKNGAKINRPTDNWNHGLDAVRYHEMETLGMANAYFIF